MYSKKIKVDKLNNYLLIVYNSNSKDINKIIVEI